MLARQSLRVPQNVNRIIRNSLAFFKLLYDSDHWHLPGARSGETQCRQLSFFWSLHYLTLAKGVGQGLRKSGYIQYLVGANSFIGERNLLKV
jgi:hypothetical protein